MDKKLYDKIHRINCLATELDALYHQAAVKLGMSDSVMCILYTIYDNGESCLLSEIYKQSGISKQTINSAIRKLEEEEIVYLKQYKGKSKMVMFTEKGKRYADDTVARLFEAEINVLKTWTIEEINTHIFLMKKFISSFKEQTEEL